MPGRFLCESVTYMASGSPLTREKGNESRLRFVDPRIVVMEINPPSQGQCQNDQHHNSEECTDSTRHARGGATDVPVWEPPHNRLYAR